MLPRHVELIILTKDLSCSRRRFRKARVQESVPEYRRLDPRKAVSVIYRLLFPPWSGIALSTPTLGFQIECHPLTRSKIRQSPLSDSEIVSREHPHTFCN